MTLEGLMPAEGTLLEIGLLRLPVRASLSFFLGRALAARLVPQRLILMTLLARLVGMTRSRRELAPVRRRLIVVSV